MDDGKQAEQVPPQVTLIRLANEFQVRGNISDRDTLLHMFADAIKAVLSQPVRDLRQESKIVLPGVRMNGARF